MSTSKIKDQSAKGRTAAGIAALALAILWPNHGVLSAQQAVTARQGMAAGDVEEGRRLFHQKCAICHVAAVKGEQPYGPKLSREQVNRSETGVKQIVLNGSGRMPGFRYALQLEQVDTIVLFLETVEVPARSRAAGEAKPVARYPQTRPRGG